MLVGGVAVGVLVGGTRVLVGGTAVSVGVPVSYTHLDVYKRQLQWKAPHK